MKTIPALAAVFVSLFSGQAVLADPISFKGGCAITAGAISGKKFVTLKCYKKSEPGNYYIRNTQWEHKNKEEYRQLARHAGRRFTCTFTQNGFVFLPQQTRNLDMSDCR